MYKENNKFFSSLAIWHQILIIDDNESQKQNSQALPTMWGLIYGSKTYHKVVINHKLNDI